jgi:hypothetical protein
MGKMSIIHSEILELREAGNNNETIASTLRSNYNLTKDYAERLVATVTTVTTVKNDYYDEDLSD